MGNACEKKDFNVTHNIDPRLSSVNQCSMPVTNPDGKTISYAPITNTNVCTAPQNSDSAKYCIYIGRYNGTGDLPENYEWLPQGGSDSDCNYWNGGHAGHTSTYSPPACCGPDCVMTLGNQYKCTRVSFNAYKPLCCFKDMACNKTGTDGHDNCFDTPLRERTCDPGYRDISSPGCQETIEGYCSGEQPFPDIINWKDLWKKNKKINIMNLLIEKQYPNKNMPPLINNLSYKGLVNSPAVIKVNSNNTNPGIASFYKWIDDNIGLNLKGSNSFSSSTNLGGALGWVGASPLEESSITEKINKYEIMKTQPCMNAVFRAGSSLKICSIKEIKDAKIVPGVLNPEGYEWSKNLINKIFEKYFSEINGYQNFFKTDEAGFKKDPDFEEELYDLCKIIPSLCIEPVTKMCSVVTTNEVGSLQTGAVYKKWCGCYMPEKEYEATDLGGLVPRECSEFCNNDKSIPRLDKNLTKLECLENTCSISDVTINLNKTIGSSLSFNQICPGCGNSKVQYGYNTSNYAINKIINSLIGTKISPGPNSSGKYFITFLLRKNSAPPTTDEYSNNPYAEVTINQVTSTSTDKQGIIATFDLISKGTETFTDKIPNTANPVDLWFNSYFTKPLNPMGEKQVTPLTSTSPVQATFSTVKYSKREIKPAEVTSHTTVPGFCVYEKDSFGFNVCVWKGATTVTSKSGSDTTNYHSKTDARTSINRCTCRIINEPINLINDTFNNINLTTNCGKIECYDKTGKEVNCGSKAEKKLETVTEILQEQYQEEIDKKYKKISYLLIGIIIFFTIYIFADLFIKRVFS